MLYKKARNRIVREISISKHIYYEKYFSTHKTNMKNLWSEIKFIVNIKNYVVKPIFKLSHDTQSINDPTQIADVLNNFFINVDKNTEKKNHS